MMTLARPERYGDVESIQEQMRDDSAAEQSYLRIITYIKGPLCRCWS